MHTARNKPIIKLLKM